MTEIVNLLFVVERIIVAIGHRSGEPRLGLTLILIFDCLISWWAAALAMMQRPPQRKIFSSNRTVYRISQIRRERQRFITTAAGSPDSIGPRCLASVLVDMVISCFVTLSPKMKEQFRKARNPSKWSKMIPQHPGDTSRINRIKSKISMPPQESRKQQSRANNLTRNRLISMLRWRRSKLCR